MGKITVEECIVDGMVIEGLKVITPKVFEDNIVEYSTPFHCIKPSCKCQ